MDDSWSPNPVVELRTAFESLPASIRRPIEFVVFGGDLPRADVSRMRWMAAELRAKAGVLGTQAQDLEMLLAQEDSLGVWGDRTREVLQLQHEGAARLREEARLLADQADGAANDAEKTLVVMFVFGIELAWRVIRTVSAAAAAGPAAQVAAAPAVDAMLVEGRARVALMRAGLEQAYRTGAAKTAARVSALGPLRVAFAVARAAALPAGVDFGTQLAQVASGDRTMSAKGSNGANPRGLDLTSVAAAAVSGAGGALGGITVAVVAPKVFPRLESSRVVLGLLQGFGGAASGLGAAALVTGWPEHAKDVLAALLSGGLGGMTEVRGGAHPEPASHTGTVIDGGGEYVRPDSATASSSEAAVLGPTGAPRGIKAVTPLTGMVTTAKTADTARLFADSRAGTQVSVQTADPARPLVDPGTSAHIPARSADPAQRLAEHGAGTQTPARDVHAEDRAPASKQENAPTVPVPHNDPAAGDRSDTSGAQVYGSAHDEKNAAQFAQVGDSDDRAAHADSDRAAGTAHVDPDPAPADLDLPRVDDAPQAGVQAPGAVEARVGGEHSSAQPPHPAHRSEAEANPAGGSRGVDSRPVALAGDSTRATPQSAKVESLGVRGTSGHSGSGAAGPARVSAPEVTDTPPPHPATHRGLAGSTQESDPSDRPHAADSVAETANHPVEAGHPSAPFVRELNAELAQLFTADPTVKADLTAEQSAQFTAAAHKTLEVYHLRRDELAAESWEQRRAAMEQGDRAEALLRYLAAVREGTGLTPRWNQVKALLLGEHGFMRQMGTGQGKSLVGVLDALGQLSRGQATELPSGRSVRVHHVITTTETLANDGVRQGAAMFHSLGYDCARWDPQHPPADPDRPTVYYMTYNERATAEFDHPPPGTTATMDEADALLIHDQTVHYQSDGQREPASDVESAAVHRVRDFLRDLLRDRVLTSADLRADRESSFATASRRWEERTGRPFTEQEAAGARIFLEVKAGRFKLNRDFQIFDGKVQLLDEYGKPRSDPKVGTDSRLLGGGHQMLEAMFRLEVYSDGTGSKVVTVEDVANTYDRLLLMSGTLERTAAEIKENFPVQGGLAKVEDFGRSKLVGEPDRIFVTEADKLKDAVARVQQLQAEGRPVLVICPHNDIAMKFSLMLGKSGIAHTAIDGRWFAEHRDNNAAEEDLLTVKDTAGDKAAVTVGTGMLGRGFDVSITDEVDQLGGVHAHMLGRSAGIPDEDHQRASRAGRNGRNGSYCFNVAASDALYRQTPLHGAKIAVTHYRVAVAERSAATVEHTETVRAAAKFGATHQQAEAVHAARAKLAAADADVAAATREMRSLTTTLQNEGADHAYLQRTMRRAEQAHAHPLAGALVADSDQRAPAAPSADTGEDTSNTGQHTPDTGHPEAAPDSVRAEPESVQPHLQGDRFARLAGWLGVPAAAQAAAALFDTDDDDDPLSRLLARAGVSTAAVAAMNQHLDHVPPASIMRMADLTDRQALEFLAPQRDRLVSELGVEPTRFAGAEGVRTAGALVEAARAELADLLGVPQDDVHAAAARGELAAALTRALTPTETADGLDAGNVVAAASTYLASAALLDLTVAIHQRSPKSCVNNGVAMMRVLHPDNESAYRMPADEPLRGHDRADTQRAFGGSLREFESLGKAAESVEGRPRGSAALVYRWLNNGRVESHLVLLHNDSDRADAPNVVVLDIAAVPGATPISPADLATPAALLRKAVPFEQWRLAQQRFIDALDEGKRRVSAIEFDSEGGQLDPLSPAQRIPVTAATPIRTQADYDLAGHRPPSDGSEANAAEGINPRTARLLASAVTGVVTDRILGGRSVEPDDPTAADDEIARAVALPALAPAVTAAVQSLVPGFGATTTTDSATPGQPDVDDRIGSRPEQSTPDRGADDLPQLLHDTWSRLHGLRLIREPEQSWLARLAPYAFEVESTATRDPHAALAVGVADADVDAGVGTPQWALHHYATTGRLPEITPDLEVDLPTHPLDIARGKWLKDLRLEQRRTQKDVASAADLTNAALSNIEKGRRPALATFEQICHALAVDDEALTAAIQWFYPEVGVDAAVPPVGWLAEQRTARGLSAAELAEAVGVTPQRIERIEAGETPTPKLFFRIARELAVDDHAATEEARRRYPGLELDSDPTAHDRAAPGGWLAARRIRLGTSQAAIAAAAGISPGYLAGIEGGDHAPTSVIFRRICRALDVAPTDLAAATHHFYPDLILDLRLTAHDPAAPGSWIVAVRHDRDLTRPELATVIGPDWGRLDHIETQTYVPRFAAFRRICQVLAVDGELLRAATRHFYPHINVDLVLAPHEIGAWVTALRHERDVSRAELSRLSGLSTRYLAQIENENQHPTFEAFRTICRALGVSRGVMIRAAREFYPELTADIDPAAHRTLGSWLAALRHDQGALARELARSARMARRSVSSIENDDYLPRLSTLRRLCEALGVGGDLLVEVVERFYAEHYARSGDRAEEELFKRHLGTRMRSPEQRRIRREIIERFAWIPKAIAGRESADIRDDVEQVATIAMFTAILNHVPSAPFTDHAWASCRRAAFRYRLALRFPELDQRTLKMVSVVEAQLDRMSPADAKLDDAVARATGITEEDVAFARGLLHTPRGHATLPPNLADRAAAGSARVDFAMTFRSALADMSDPVKAEQLVALRHDEGKSLSRSAAQLGLAPDVAKKMYDEAMARLRDTFDVRNPTAGGSAAKRRKRSPWSGTRKPPRTPGSDDFIGSRPHEPGDSEPEGNSAATPWSRHSDGSASDAGAARTPDTVGSGEVESAAPRRGLLKLVRQQVAGSAEAHTVERPPTGWDGFIGSRPDDSVAPVPAAEPEHGGAHQDLIGPVDARAGLPTYVPPSTTTYQQAERVLREHWGQGARTDRLVYGWQRSTVQRAVAAAQECAEHAAENARRVQALSVAELRDLVRVWPEFVGNAGGFPREVRDQANRLAIAKARAELERASARGRLSRRERALRECLLNVEDLLIRANQRAATVETPGVPAPRVLLEQFDSDDPSARSVIISLGSADPDAEAWHVDGSDSNLRRLDLRMQLACNHYETAMRENPDRPVRVVVWSGTDGHRLAGELAALAAGSAAQPQRQLVVHGTGGRPAKKALAHAQSARSIDTVVVCGESNVKTMSDVLAGLVSSVGVYYGIASRTSAPKTRYAPGVQFSARFPIGDAGRLVAALQDIRYKAQRYERESFEAGKPIDAEFLLYVDDRTKSATESLRNMGRILAGRPDLVVRHDLRRGGPLRFAQSIERAAAAPPESADTVLLPRNSRGVPTLRATADDTALARAAFEKRGASSPEVLLHQGLPDDFTRAAQLSADNRRWWDALSGDEQRAVVALHPAVIGKTAGLPSDVLNYANDLARHANITVLHAKGSRFVTRTERHVFRNLYAVGEALTRSTTVHRDIPTPIVSTLALEPEAFGGNGSGTFAIGNCRVEDADHVVWYVDGVNTRLQSAPARLSSARNLYEELVRADRNAKVVVVCWLGYEAPANNKEVWASLPGLAEAGGRLFARDVLALRAVLDTTMSMLGYSYGSPTISEGAVGGRLDGVFVHSVVMGSPGRGHRFDSATDASSRHRWVLAQSDDPVTGFGGDTPEARGRVLGAGPFGLGPDPATDVNTIRVRAERGFPYTLAPYDGHGEYLEYSLVSAAQPTESLRHAAWCLSGRGAEVPTEPHRPTVINPTAMQRIRTRVVDSAIDRRAPQLDSALAAPIDQHPHRDLPGPATSDGPAEAGAAAAPVGGTRTGPQIAVQLDLTEGGRVYADVLKLGMNAITVEVGRSALDLAALDRLCRSVARQDVTLSVTVPAGPAWSRSAIRAQVAEIAATLRRHGVRGNLHAFDGRVLKAAAELAPDWHRAVMVNTLTIATRGIRGATGWMARVLLPGAASTRAVIDDAHLVGATGLAVPHELLSEEFVRQTAEADLRLAVWGASGSARIREILALDVDEIWTKTDDLPLVRAETAERGFRVPEPPRPTPWSGSAF
ncbi:helix-turn-helix domain-containing protein [Nocardia sp. NPDC049149]|uniref:helix-turn-helix domain-containing protein n=1 Tax=Nocardia sp. NPDC049149 TaxID=3364315 RepID=UPI0037132800